jgi:hypothetical protein
MPLYYLLLIGISFFALGLRSPVGSLTWQEAEKTLKGFDVAMLAIGDGAKG